MNNIKTTEGSVKGIINYVEAPCGTGKTNTLIDKLNGTYDKFLVAVSTNRNGKELALKIDSGVFINATTGTESVYKQVEKAIADHNCIIITHSGLKTLLPIAYRLGMARAVQPYFQIIACW